MGVNEVVLIAALLSFTSERTVVSKQSPGYLMTNKMVEYVHSHSQHQHDGKQAK